MNTPDPKNVLFITRKYPPAHGGMETFSWELTNRYPGNKRIIKFAQRTQRQILWILPLLCVRALRQVKTAEIVHLGDLVLAPIARLLRRKTTAPIVATVHALELTYQSGLLKWMIDSSLSAITHFVAVSDYTRDLLIERGVHESKITVIPHGVDIPEIDKHKSRSFVEQLTNADANTSVLLSVGRLQRRKGVAWFIESVLPLLNGIDYTYLITSTGPEEERIRSFIEKHRLQGKVRLLGKVSDETLHHLYAGSDIFIMPNIPVDNDAEGFGFVAIEAAAHGLPVLASNLEGIPSAIQNNKNGKLLTTKDAEGYADQIIYWHEHKDGLHSFGAAARDFSAENCTWDTPIQQYEELFSDL